MVKQIFGCLIVAGMLVACGGTPEYVALRPAQQKAVQAELGYLSKVVEVTRWSVKADKVEIRSGGRVNLPPGVVLRNRRGLARCRRPNP